MQHVCTGVLQESHQHLWKCAQAHCKGYSWCNAHGHVVRVTSTFGTVCRGMLQGLHHQLVHCVWVYCEGYINSSMHGHVSRVTLTIGAGFMYKFLFLSYLGQILTVLLQPWFVLKLNRSWLRLKIFSDCL